MGLFDYVHVNDPRFVCSEGHDLSGMEFQSKDFGCEMGYVTIEDGRVSTRRGLLGVPEADYDSVEIYTSCTRCPAFVQFGTGNLAACDVTFEVKLEKDTVVSVVRTSPTTADWLRDEPLARHMKRCEGPMSYADAAELHGNYRAMRPEQLAEFEAWAGARARALQAGESWPWDLAIGEYPT